MRSGWFLGGFLCLYGLGAAQGCARGVVSALPAGDVSASVAGSRDGEAALPGTPQQEWDAGPSADAGPTSSADGSASGPIPDSATGQAGASRSADAGTSAGDDGSTPSTGCTVSQCGADCVDTLTDPRHCGKCDLACPGSGSCVSGECEVSECVTSSFDGHAYLSCYGSRLTTWSEARDFCRSGSMDLAIIESDAENSHVAGASGFIISGWIGLNDRGEQDAWRWVDATGSEDGPQVGTYAPWGTRDGGRCASLQSWQWWDYDCDASNGFFCEERNPD
jgi:hypothetical protein